MARHASVLEQAIPVTGISAEEAAHLSILDGKGKALPGSVEIEARDEHGAPSWLRLTAVVALPARGATALTVGTAARAPHGLFEVRKTYGGLSVETASYRLSVSDPSQLELTAGGNKLLSGKWGVELIGDARGILWGENFQEFIPKTAEVEEQTDTRATVVFKGYVSTTFRKENAIDPARRADIEFRLFLNAFSPRIRFSWRLTNQFGHKLWLKRYALRLPLADRAPAADMSRKDVALLPVGRGRLAVTADFVTDLGKGAGMSVSADGRGLLQGGIDMPPDGGYFVGPVPDIHRLFHPGMSRTFTGTIVPGGSRSDAAESLAPLDIVLPPQYYSDVKALPEEGDPVTFGEFEPQIRHAAEWLLKHQWRGTLWWGEWYREWDDTRNEGTEEASNGHSPLAPLYHYWRTGDARFLRCAQRSAQYVWDIQMTKSSAYVGWMFHTRRHLFDELDWIHPRYQRATGGLVSSHVFLNPIARKEIVQTIRNFHDKYFDEMGVPHDWDKVKNVRSNQEDGVDTSNFMEALTYCYRETGDRYFLDEALKMSRWTAARYKLRGTRKNDDWNWNLTNYALRGLYTLWVTSHDRAVFDLMSDMSRKTLDNKTTDGMNLIDGIGGGDAHFVFYHCWVSTRIAKLAPDRDSRIQDLLEVARREVATVRPDGVISLRKGMSSGLPTVWTSYYDAKALVAYVPVLTAHLASRGSTH